MNNDLKKFMETMTSEQKLALEVHELLHAILNPPQNPLHDTQFRELSPQEIVEFLSQKQEDNV